MPNGPTPWICEIDNQRQDVSAEQVLFSNNGQWLVNKAIAGQGILIMPRWALKPYIESGELTELIITPSINITQNENLGIFLLYQQQRYQIPKIKAAVDFFSNKNQRGFIRI